VATNRYDESHKGNPGSVDEIDHAKGATNNDNLEGDGPDNQRFEPGSVNVVSDLWEGSGGYGTEVTELTPCNGYLYFRAWERSWGGTSEGRGLYRYVVLHGGSDSNPSPVEKLVEGELTYLTCFNNELYYFKAPPDASYSDPWWLAKFDGEETILYDTGENYYHMG
jgi:hypothetical protein